MKKSRLLFQHRICRGIATREYIPGKRVYAKSVSGVRIPLTPQLKINAADPLKAGCIFHLITLPHGHTCTRLWRIILINVPF